MALWRYCVFFVFTNWRQPCIIRWWLAFFNNNLFFKIVPPILFYSFILNNIHFLKKVLFIYLTTPCSMWDPSFLTRDWNHAPFIENTESQPLDHQGSSNNVLKQQCVFKLTYVHWWAAVYGVAESRTRLKWLSSSSSGNKIWGETEQLLFAGESENVWQFQAF